MSEKFRLSRLERYSLSNQLRILEALYPDEAEDLATQREVFERGYEMMYPWYFEHIYDGQDVMTEEESKEVWDTLDMFDAINRGIESHGLADLQNELMSKFLGYDGNNETKFMAFAEFTVERLKRFEYVPMKRPGYWNSHMPVREIYRRMLEAWRNIPVARRSELQPDEVRILLAAAVHPDNR